jgi:membrane protein YdbS with pleckstrin-like domain
MMTNRTPGDCVPDPESGGVDADAVLDGAWKRVSPRFVVVEVVSSLVFGLAVGLGAAIFWWLTDAVWVLYLGGAITLLCLVTVFFEPRRVRSIGYRLRQDDLLFRRGVLMRRMVAVPYGRMQLVDITRGPLSRWLGLSELKLVTAAAASGVTIPGLTEADADTLRDQLVHLAETRRAGL